MIGDDIDLDAAVEAGFPPEHMLNRLVDALRAARAEITRLTAANEEAANVADRFVCGACGMDGKAGKAIRALVEPKPPEGEVT